MGGVATFACLPFQLSRPPSSPKLASHLSQLGAVLFFGRRANLQRHLGRSPLQRGKDLNLDLKIAFCEKPSCLWEKQEMDCLLSFCDSACSDVLLHMWWPQLIEKFV